MDKRTVSSAHQRIDELSQRVIKLEVMTEEVLVRMRRLESIMIGSAGAIILLLIASMYSGWLVLKSLFPLAICWSLMLAELAAFNAGFAVIKQTVLAGKDITSALGSLSNMVGAEEDLRAAGNRKKKSVWAKLAGKNSNDFEEFISLHQIKEQRKELESMVRLYASFSWDDYLAFEAKMRVKRKREAEERERMIARQLRYLTIGAASILSALGFYLLFAFTNFLKEL